jgi:hypothetical protein
MRLHRLTLCFAAVIGCCASGGGAPASLDGRWNAYSDRLGSALTLNLSSSGARVSGTGTYRVGAVRTGSVVISGTYRAPSADLAITYDHGETVTFTAAATDSDHMKGKLTYKSGTVIDIEFVRP